jgi:hypothetical protein
MKTTTVWQNGAKPIRMPNTVGGNKIAATLASTSPAYLDKGSPLTFEQGKALAIKSLEMEIVAIQKKIIQVKNTQEVA